MSERINPYEVLGKWGTEDGKPLPKDADKDMIKKAYRRASKKAHPDRNGGDVKAMIKVNVANDILSDPKRRERFDLGQDDEATPAPEVRARVALAQAFERAWKLPGRVNYVAAAKDFLAEMANQESRTIFETEKLIKSLTDKKPLVSFTPSEDNPVNIWEGHLDACVRSLRDRQDRAKEVAKACDRARQILIAYSCSIIEYPMYDASGIGKILGSMY